MKQRTLSILVDNTAGVLSRLSGLFSRRAYNIDSISAGVTADPRYTRITVVATGDDDLVLDQITNQVRKQVDVRDVKVLDPKNSVNRELMLIKIRCEAEERQNVISLADVFRANIIDVGRHSLIIELVGGASKLSAFLELLDGYEILELARTGITGLSRGMEDVRYLEDLEK
ncbi:MAG: acetolactate synthase small subunit [Lachnospiraceae bacterium]|jgi:acetolactate synthase-1/3 small subunit|nr:acetolactate synthase small subunit [Eubacterium sp.]MCI6794469.1 acetolactate synthase small subunit [Lachnospiraceae bacterium]MDD6684213.1 acetolactate synthase small subunit [Lachnospiraceae bacterium]MDD7048543.1 acetolactate synthase small subunit [Lachnospiraceae bacterium]HCE78536.1 acetolactate synthase small subunit [Lachnospiraceae bacterium]